jgi:hypothetical protein
VSTARSAKRPNEEAAAQSADAPARADEPDSSELTADERSQIAARLRLSPSERLRYLEDMIAFEELARRARRLS